MNSKKLAEIEQVLGRFGTNILGVLEAQMRTIESQRKELRDLTEEMKMLRKRNENGKAQEEIVESACGKLMDMIDGINVRVEDIKVRMPADDPHRP